MAHDYRELAPADWLDVEVLVDQVWLDGELRAWIRQDEAAGWEAYVQYRAEPGKNYLARFPAEQVRKAEPPA